MPPQSNPDPRTRYLFKLHPPSSSPSTIQSLFSLPTLPKLHVDTSNPRAQFVEIGTATRDAIKEYLGPGKGLFIHLGIPAGKALDNTTALGEGKLERPGQDDWLAKYFFYGTLGEPEKLAEVLGLDDDFVPVLRKASVKGGKLKIWRDKYRALVGGGAQDAVEGYASKVENEAQEDALRHYEGTNYEVVVEGGETVNGLTFRLCGEVGELR
ncbi:hypothetical protein FB567DRAFT_594908 [Paraphoma chrysanthemicola]|uniref:Gamma-glutamylcyclotransferase AIG2-like domain-containing protein n=1 Tax=Paraphoma chrysanthemicola TaxID=798071 RepID=A0A8K0QSC3_9PLEO|nr:hypothetical protein FB567DRAFT_458709 [Paraphoma chrysanthemicola]KAH7082434.1 hypothetical protein FB567DRAFT_594908 [Paraphoma chrysanthemicola]